MHCFLKLPRSDARNSPLSEVATLGVGALVPIFPGSSKYEASVFLSSAAPLHNMYHPFNNNVLSADQRNQHHCPLSTGTPSLY